ncbi:hypothetical protein ACJMK2_034624 [Sinanodonta woodiana]|uniref:Protein sleepless n=1 Tax=Sinanodonta woodiana TaxID=1069815 RepID=A0ABD3WW27_SINWO
MKWIVSAFVAVFTAAVLFEIGASIKCYECNSYFQHDCADWFNNRTFNLNECPPEATLCRKIVQEVYYNDEWNVRYIRQCAVRGEVGGEEGRVCMDRTGTSKVKVKYCHCNNQEGCNSAESVNIPAITFFVPLLATFAMLVFKKL